MPCLQITKEGENPTITGPPTSQEECERQLALVEPLISIRHREDGVVHGRDEMADLGWVQIAAQVITDVQIVGDDGVPIEAPVTDEPDEALEGVAG